MFMKSFYSIQSHLIHFSILLHFNLVVRDFIVFIHVNYYWHGFVCICVVLNNSDWSIIIPHGPVVTFWSLFEQCLNLKLFHDKLFWKYLTDVSLYNLKTFKFSWRQGIYISQFDNFHKFLTRHAIGSLKYFWLPLSNQDFKRHCHEAMKQHSDSSFRLLYFQPENYSFKCVS